LKCKFGDTVAAVSPFSIALFKTIEYNSLTLLEQRTKKERNMQTLTKQARLTEALLSGEQLTAKQITARFGIANPTATISDIRFSGIPVYANPRKNSKGEVVTRYRVGKASRQVVAAGYRALAAGLV
jgi:hypothetical protein